MAQPTQCYICTLDDAQGQLPDHKADRVDVGLSRVGTLHVDLRRSVGHVLDARIKRLRLERLIALNRSEQSSQWAVHCWPTISAARTHPLVVTGATEIGVLQFPIAVDL